MINEILTENSLFLEGFLKKKKDKKPIPNEFYNLVDSTVKVLNPKLKNIDGVRKVTIQDKNFISVYIDKSYLSEKNNSKWKKVYSDILNCIKHNVKGIKAKHEYSSDYIVFECIQLQMKYEVSVQADTDEEGLPILFNISFNYKNNIAS